MSQIAILEQNIGNGKRNKGVMSTHHSDARAWPVTVTTVTKTIAEFYGTVIPCFPDCKFTTEENILIAAHSAKNIGDKRGLIGIFLAELNHDGSVKDTLCNRLIMRSPGECAYLKYTLGDCILYTAPCGDTAWSTIGKRDAGTYYFGVKTWGEDELEPPFPAPAAAIEGRVKRAEAPAAALTWGMPDIGIPVLEPWQWGLIATGFVTAGVVTYAGVKTAKGQPVI